MSAFDSLRVLKLDDAFSVVLLMTLLFAVCECKIIFYKILHCESIILKYFCAINISHMKNVEHVGITFQWVQRSITSESTSINSH